MDDGNLKIHLGCGDILLPGFLNIDACNPKADVLAKAEELAFPPESVQEVVAYHFLDVLWPEDGRLLLKRIYAWLCPGGTLTMEVPDIIKCCALILDAERRDDIEELESGPRGLRGLFGQGRDGLANRWGFTPKTITAALIEAGFRRKDIYLGDGGSHYCPDRDMKVVATKRVLP
jgi:hypothetical protein